MSIRDKFQRIERLKRSMAQREDFRVHAVIDGQDSFLLFSDAYQIALDENYIKTHKVVFHDFEERGCGLLSALINSCVGVDLSEHDEILNDI